MFFLCVLVVILSEVNGMRDGEPVEWNRYGYLVKVMIRHQPSNRVVACTGTIVSPSIIITSSRCFDSNTNMFDSLAIVARINGSSGHRRAIRRIEKDGDFAVLSIHPLREELCPLKPSPARLSRLPLKVSLTETPWIGVNLDQLSEKTCRITGFTTHESVNYTTIHQVMQLAVQLVREGDMVIANSSKGKGVCWDDIGLPLECQISDGIWTQVGLLHSVTRDDVPDRINVPPSDCDDIRSLRFSVFADTLPKLIKKVDVIEILQSTEKCFE